MECKFATALGLESDYFTVLIETLWNVNETEGTMNAPETPVLIETLWNVN